GEVHRTLGPAEAGCDALNSHGARKGRETRRSERWRSLLGRFQVGIRIAAAGQRSQGSASVDLDGAPVWPSGATDAAEAAFMLAAIAAAAVVVRNARLFIVTSLNTCQVFG